jgi:hypothetical protein
MGEGGLTGSVRFYLTTTTRTTKTEATQTHRIELIDFPALCALMNEHFGRDWLTDIDCITSHARREFGAEAINKTKAAQ